MQLTVKLSKIPDYDRKCGLWEWCRAVCVCVSQQFALIKITAAAAAVVDLVSRKKVDFTLHIRLAQKHY